MVDLYFNAPRPDNGETVIGPRQRMPAAGDERLQHKAKWASQARPSMMIGIYR